MTKVHLHCSVVPCDGELSLLPSLSTQKQPCPRHCRRTYAPLPSSHLGMKTCTPADMLAWT